MSVVDAQEGVDNGVLVFVIGYISNNAAPYKKFVQTFYLAVQQMPVGFYVKNDIFRYLKEDVPPATIVVPPTLADHHDLSSINHSTIVAKSTTEETPISTETPVQTQPQANPVVVIDIEEEKETPSSTSISEVPTVVETEKEVVIEQLPVKPIEASAPAIPPTNADNGEVNQIAADSQKKETKSAKQSKSSKNKKSEEYQKKHSNTKSTQDAQVQIPAPKAEVLSWAKVILKPEDSAPSPQQLLELQEQQKQVNQVKPAEKKRGKGPHEGTSNFIFVII